MGFFSDLFDPKPGFVKDIVKKIEGYSIDINSDVKAQLESDAIFYVENKKNWEMIEEGYEKRKRDAEYFSLYFLYLSARDALRSGKYHVYAGMVTIEGNIACSIGCDCLQRLFERGHINKKEAKDAKIFLKNIISDVGIG
jgi:hypothetical protein